MLERTLELASEAGAIVLSHYQQAGSSPAWAKDDGSPLTQADLASHRFLVDALGRTGLPVLSEEDSEIDYAVRTRWDRFWLVDPLDGTKDFVERTGDFCVCVALIERDRPILGVVVAPALGVSWYAERGAGAYRREAGKSEQIHCANRSRNLVGVHSRFHVSPEVHEFFAAHGVRETRAFGSAVKFGRVADGQADVYPCLGKTKEWDTAAGQIVVEEAGGTVLGLESRAPLRYNRANLLTGSFIAAAPGFRWH